MSASGQVDIQIIASDEASDVLSNVQSNLNGVAASANATTGNMTALGTAATSTNTSFLSQMSAITAVTGGFMAFGTSLYSVERAQNMVDRVNLMVQRDTVALQSAQEAYNTAVTKYGPASQQATDAATKLSLAQEKLNVDTDRAAVSQQNYEIQLIQVASIGVPMLLTALAKLPAAYAAVGDIGAKITGLTSTATAATGAVTAAPTAATGVEATGVAAAGTAGAAALGAVAAGAAAAAAEIQGASTVLGNLNDKIKAGTVTTKDLASALLSTLSPVQLMSQGVVDFLAKIGLMPTQAGTVSDQTIAAFQNLYDKLVGHSIWPEMWNQIITTTETSGTTVGTTVTDLTTKLQAGWGTATQTMQQNWDSLVVDVTQSTAAMKETENIFLTWYVAFSKQEMAAVLNTTVDQMGKIVATVSSSGTAMQANWNSTLDAMVASTRSKFQAMANDIASQVNAIIATLEAAKAKISSHSIWPDMLNEMVGQTGQAMDAIQAEFNQGFESPTGIIPTIQAAGGQAAAGVEGPAVTPSSATEAQGQVITLPVNVYLDGQLIHSNIEQRIVQTIMQNGTRSRRPTRV